MTAASIFQRVAAAFSPAKIEAKAAAQDWGQSINIARAKDRLWEVFERDQGPGDVRASLAGAMQGDIRLQHQLFSAMVDTWPKLQKGLNEMARRVVTESWKTIPFSKRGEEPDDAAQEMAAEIEAAIWKMKPRPERQELSLEGTIRYLVFSYYYGHGVLEIRWQKEGGEWVPRCTKPVPARFFGYAADTPDDDTEDRLLFFSDGQAHGLRGEDFPEHRFLVAINSGHPAHPAMAAPLRALAPYWLAAVYGLKWMMNFTQLYGVPWRHAEVADAKDEGPVKNALSAIGSLGYIVTRAGTKINVLDAAKGGDAVPQALLMELADKQCDQFILGQTLTSGTDNSGSRALGDIHQQTLQEAVRGVADFVGQIISHQLIPSMIALNYGEGANLPEFWARSESEKDEIQRAQRMEILARIGVPMDKQYVYDDLGIPVPADDADLFRPAANGAQGDPATGGIGRRPPHETEQRAGSVEAADASAVSAHVLERVTGVARDWLGPVKPFFDRLASLSMAETVTDEDFISALEKAAGEIPELFEKLDAETLRRAMEETMRHGVREGIKP